MEELLAQIEALTGSVAAFGGAVASFSSSVSTFTANIDGMVATVINAASVLDTAKGSISGFADGATAASSAAQQGAAGLDSLSASSGSVTKSLEGLKDPVGTVAKMLEGLGPEGEAAAAALLVLTAAITATAGALLGGAAAAISFSQEKSALIATLGALSGDGAKTNGMIEDLALKLHMSEGVLADWSKSLLAAGVSSDKLEDSLKTLAAAKALMGDSGAAAAEKMIKQLASGGAAADKLVKSLQEGGPKSAKMLAQMGLSTKDLAAALGMTPEQFGKAKLSAEQLNDALNKAMQKKGAGPLAELGNTWPAIKAQLADGFGDLFEDLGKSVKPFMAEVQKLAAMFFAGGKVQSAVKPIIMSVYQTLFTWATKAVTAIRGVVDWFMASGKAGGMFSGVIASLKSTWTALGAVWKTLSAFLAPVIGMLKSIFTNATVLSGIKTIFTGIAAAIGVVVVVFAALVAAAAAVAATFVAFGGAIAGAVTGAVGAVTGFVSSAIEALTGLGPGASEGASNFIAGLVNGISAGAGAVMAAVGGIASGLLGAFTGALGIHSPSTVMLEHGEENIAGAAATGIDKGGAKVKASAKGMADAAKPKGKGAKGVAAGGEGAGNYFDFRGSTFVNCDEGFVRDVMERVMEEVSGEAGAAPEGG